MRSTIQRVCVLWLCLPLLSCAKDEEPFRKVVVPVTGQLRVDGQPPDEPLQIQAHPVSGLDTEHPTASASVTEPGGQFTFSTYETGDGLPPGAYRLTVTWLQFNVMSSSYGGPDKLNGRYSDPEKSGLEIAVEGETPVDLGILELSTK